MNLTSQNPGQGHPPNTENPLFAVFQLGEFFSQIIR
jgi:hypothetical protein